MDKNKLKDKHSLFGSKDQVLPAETKFHSAIHCFQSGKIEDAKTLFQEILSTDPKHAESWFLTALIADHEGLHQRAIGYLEHALAIDPKNLKYLYTLGDIYYAQNYLDEGVKLFECIIEINPEDNNGYFNLAVLLQKQKKYEEALLNYRKVLALDEKNISAIYNIGNILIDMKDFINAASYFKQVIEAQPNSDDAFDNLGFLYIELGDLDIAMEYLNKAVLINPENSNALNNLGKVHEKKGLFLDALEYFEKAIVLKPEFAGTYSNRGCVLNELNKFDAALIDFDKSLSLDFDFAEAHSNRGNTLKEMLRFEDALNAYEQAISLSPNYADAHHNKALLLLLMQNLEAGWLIYAEWRWKVNDRSVINLKTKIPKWDGKINDNKNKILFWAEQGIGDEVFYLGMLKNFAEVDAKITVAADNRLHALFKRSMPEIEFVDSKKIFSECDENLFDYQAPIGDIGLLFSVDKVIEKKSPKPFLNVNEFRCGDIKNKNHKFTDKIVCGLSWKSGNKNIGLSKSIELIELSPLLLIEGVEFVSLQSGSTKDEIEFVEKKIGKKIHTVDDLDVYNDIDGLTSLISICDFVVTTSNITAHLTGSIGKKGMVLLPRSKGKVWYWHSGVGQSIWYPSLQLASQKQMNDWTDPINKCKEWILEQL